MQPSIGAYAALRFDDIASAVDFCSALVPHIARRGANEDEDRAVVWFHVPTPAPDAVGDCCYLFASAGALAAAREAGLCLRIATRVIREALPRTAVLLFGTDAPLLGAARAGSAPPAAAPDASARLTRQSSSR